MEVLLLFNSINIVFHYNGIYALEHRCAGNLCDGFGGPYVCFSPFSTKPKDKIKQTNKQKVGREDYASTYLKHGTIKLISI